MDAAINQPANYGEIGTGSGAASTILKLFKSSSFGHLNDQNNTPPGGGNIDWGLEWDAKIAPGGTFIISKDLNLVGVVGVVPVPEPTAWTFVLMGLLSCGFYTYRPGRRIG
ncbi:MAG: PEP-CTERM sorting domain-containing protein [Verrucomicrobiia bacterium]